MKCQILFSRKIIFSLLSAEFASSMVSVKYLISWYLFKIIIARSSFAWNNEWPVENWNWFILNYALPFNVLLKSSNFLFFKPQKIPWLTLRRMTSIIIDWYNYFKTLCLLESKGEVTSLNICHGIFFLSIWSWQFAVSYSWDEIKLWMYWWIAKLRKRVR